MVGWNGERGNGRKLEVLRKRVLKHMTDMSEDKGKGKEDRRDIFFLCYAGPICENGRASPSDGNDGAGKQLKQHRDEQQWRERGKGRSQEEEGERRRR